MQHDTSNLIDLMSTLTLSEIDALLSLGQEGDDGSSLADGELALTYFAQEAAGLLSMTRDYIQVHGAVDDNFLDQLMEMEENSQYDHAVAIAIGEGRDPPPPPPRRGRRVRRTRAKNSKSNASSVIHDQRSHQSKDSSSSSSRSSSPVKLSSKSKSTAASGFDPPPPCIVCGEIIEGSIIYSKCGHPLDRFCLTIMFKNSVKDESLFPPQCCQHPIAFSEAQEFLDEPLRRLYQDKSREFSTKNRVYCHNPSCSAFLGSATSLPTSFICPSCETATCGSCKVEAHPGETCEDHSDDVVLTFGKAQGWQRCPSCKHLVELSIGCYHMTCRCGQQFCYLCAKAWKGCECPLFEDVADP